MVPALTESETHQIRVFLRKIHRASLPSTTACRNGPHCVYHRHQRCWFAHVSDREISKADAANKNDNNFHEAQIQSSIKPAANCEVPTTLCTSINADIPTKPCSTKPPLCPSTRVESVAIQTCSNPASPFTQDRAREYKTSALGGSSCMVKNEGKGRKMTGFQRHQKKVVLMDILKASQASMAD